jgi:hypothetical protein
LARINAWPRRLLAEVGGAAQASLGQKGPIPGHGHAETGKITAMGRAEMMLATTASKRVE